MHLSVVDGIQKSGTLVPINLGDSLQQFFTLGNTIDANK
jgi:hypothetical protein